MLARQLKEGSGYLHGERCAFLAIALADAIECHAGYPGDAPPDRGPPPWPARRRGSSYQFENPQTV